MAQPVTHMAGNTKGISQLAPDEEEPTMGGKWPVANTAANSSSACPWGPPQDRHPHAGASGQVLGLPCWAGGLGRGTSQPERCQVWSPSGSAAGGSGSLHGLQEHGDFMGRTHLEPSGWRCWLSPDHYSSTKGGRRTGHWPPQAVPSAPPPMQVPPIPATGGERRGRS